MTLRLAFMGTPDFAVPTLAELIAQGHDIAAVYSQPPRPKGRGMALEPSPVHQFAQKAGLKVLRCDPITRERRKPHFEVLSLLARKTTR